ncbi:MAG: SdrD B-like domain-containing protein [Actinomycetota bacterium]
MQGFRKWCVLAGVVVLLTAALFTAPGFAFQGSYRQAGGGGGDEGDTGLTPQDIIDFLEDLLFGDEPSDGGGGGGTVPDDGEVEEPDGGDAPAPPAEEPAGTVTPPGEEPAAGQEGPDKGKPDNDEKDGASEVPEPAGTTHDDPGEPPVEPGSISGCKFLDANRNHRRDEGEPGIAGVGIRLEDGCKTWKAVTAEDGSYAFTGLEPGSYEVEVIESTVPEGHFHTTDPDEAVCLKPGHMHRTVDFGNGVREEEEEPEPEPGSISGCKFLDANRNHRRDEGEPGIAGVGIRLEDGCKTWKAVTAEDGSYAFTGLEPGGYEVEVIESTVPEGHFHTTDPDEAVCLKPDHMHRTVDFGNGVCDEEPEPEPEPGSISGRKWRDGDANGVYSFSDCPMAGVEIELWSEGELVASCVSSDAACDKGSYCFGDLEPGTYTVREVSPAGYYPTNPASGEWTVELRAGEKRGCVNFLNARSLSISGTKWEWKDGNGDGVAQDGEKYPLEGVTVLLSSACPCSPEPLQTVTGADGAYIFERLKPGIYTVTETVPEDWYAVAPANASHVVELLCDYDQSDIDFVNARRPSISGCKWEWVDDNGNGEVDEGEYYPVEGVEIRLLQDGVEVRPSGFTAADGTYAFSSLEPGTYTVAEVLQQGWYALDPSGGTQQVSLAAGVDASDVDFLNSQVEVAGEVVAPVAPAAATQAGELPQTGMNQVPLILAAAALVLVGLLLLALGAIRRRSA